MIRNLSRITVLLLWLFCGGSLNSQVHQEPSSILGVVRDSETISCSHSVSSYNVILWYQQSAGDTALKLIGYIYYANPTLEEPFQQHFNVTGDGSTKSQLRVLKLRQPQDTGVYYCAASRHDDSVTTLLSTKKPLFDNAPHEVTVKKKEKRTPASNCRLQQEINTDISIKNRLFLC
ncbi:T-cell receptor beta chain [Scophthalmus maximus]|nr:T-cell receptor beta chain [Scophthalmus maximus]